LLRNFSFYVADAADAAADAVKSTDVKKTIRESLMFVTLSSETDTSNQGRRHGFESGGRTNFLTPHFLASGGDKILLR